jgi:hypothetical protein
MNWSKVYGKNVTRSYDSFASPNVLPVVSLVDALGRGPVPALQPAAQRSDVCAQTNDGEGKTVAPGALALLITQGNHGIEPRCFVRRPNSEE